MRFNIISASSFSTHLPGVLNQHDKQAAHGFMVYLAKNIFSTSAPADIAHAKMPRLLRAYCFCPFLGYC